jgi:hypothetical protein
LHGVAWDYQSTKINAPAAYWHYEIVVSLNIKRATCPQDDKNKLIDDVLKALTKAKRKPVPKMTRTN